MTLFPIPVPGPAWATAHTATIQGRQLKIVPCENCSTEYVYVMEREALGVGTSILSLNDKGAQSHARSAAAETLKSVLENDFDPVPCLQCGHYQRYMFPKLLPNSKGCGLLTVTFAVIGIGLIAVGSACYHSINYLDRPSDEDLWNLVTPWSVFLLMCLVGLGLWIRQSRKVSRFDPNLADQQARIAIGRSRAITRAEFEKLQREKEQEEKRRSQGKRT